MSEVQVGLGFRDYVFQADLVSYLVSNYDEGIRDAD